MCEVWTSLKPGESSLGECFMALRHDINSFWFSKEMCFLFSFF